MVDVDSVISVEGVHPYPDISDNREKNVAGKHQLPELIASSSSECSLLTEEELDLVEDVGPFQLDTSCGGLEVRIGLADKELGVDLSKKVQALRSNVTSFHTSVLSTLGLDKQHQEKVSITDHPANAIIVTRSTEDENQEEWYMHSLNTVRVLLSEKSQELGSIVLSNVHSMYSSLMSRQDENSLFLCTSDQNSNQHEKVFVDRPYTREVPW